MYKLNFINQAADFKGTNPFKTLSFDSKKEAKKELKKAEYTINGYDYSLKNDKSIEVRPNF